jgi:hypothetical protein
MLQPTGEDHQLQLQERVQYTTHMDQRSHTGQTEWIRDAVKFAVAVWCHAQQLSSYIYQFWFDSYLAAKLQ